jgi:epoxyqueuosine reductase QueG
MSFESDLETELNSQGADFIGFVDLSQLPTEQNRQYPNAILVGVALSPSYIYKIASTPSYAKEMKLHNRTSEDEFHIKESNADRIADSIADYITAKGYSAYSQSESSLLSAGFYDEKTKSTPLPHKTIARLAGIGWIGKHSLLVTPEFGSAICISTILTNAPLKPTLPTPITSSCGNCTACKDICEVAAIEGNAWNIGISRDELVNVFKCNTCLKCLAHCPWTQMYMKRSSVE